MAKKTLYKDARQRTVGTEHERRTLLSQGWSEKKPAAPKSAPKEDPKTEQKAAPKPDAK